MTQGGVIDMGGGVGIEVSLGPRELIFVVVVALRAAQSTVDRLV